MTDWLAHGGVAGLVVVVSMEEIGGKKAFIKGVTGRLGLPSGTRVAPHVAAKVGRKASSPPPTRHTH